MKRRYPDLHIKIPGTQEITINCSDKKKDIQTYQQIIYEAIGIDKEVARSTYPFNKFMMTQKLNQLKRFGR